MCRCSIADRKNSNSSFEKSGRRLFSMSLTAFPYCSKVSSSLPSCLCLFPFPLPWIVFPFSFPSSSELRICSVLFSFPCGIGFTDGVAFSARLLIFGDSSSFHFSCDSVSLSSASSSSGVSSGANLFVLLLSASSPEVLPSVISFVCFVFLRRLCRGARHADSLVLVPIFGAGIRYL